MVTRFARDAQPAPRAPSRRAGVGALLMAGGTGLVIVLSAIWGFMDWPTLILIAMALGVGFYVHTWLALPAVYIGLVGMAVLLDVGLFLIMGSDWWEQQNAAHYPGNDPAYAKLLGDLLEYAVFGVFFALLAGVGVLAQRAVSRLTRET